MKKVILFIFAITLMAACKNEEKVSVDLIKGINGDQVITQAGQSYTIKGLNDSTTTVLFLIRHAEKDLMVADDPSLNEAGRKRAERLAELLGNTRLDYIGSTITNRTKETVTPLSGKKNVAMGFYDPDGQASSITGLFTGPYKGKKGLVVGHSNTIPGLLNSFLKDGKYKDIPENDYSRMYVLSYVSPEDVTVLELNY